MEMNSPVGSNALDAQGVVGKPLDRVDGRLKVTGGARYAYEIQQGNNTLYGFVVEASIGKGKIKSIDTRAAEKAPGIVLVLTHRNAPAQGTGNHREAHPVLTGPEVTGYGQPVAFVVARSFEEARAAIASRQLKRPVKIALTRQQIFHVTTHRSDTIQRVRLGTDREGRILAIGHDVFSGNLPSEQTYEGAALQTRTLYAGSNRLTRHRLAPLDIPVASSMRAPGESVGLMALECAMDELAEKLNVDPIELRMRNEPTEDPEKHIPYSSRHLIACMQDGARRFAWDKRNPKPGQVRDGHWLVGMGMAAATRGNPLQLSKANVRLNPDGTATVRMAMTDIGTGTYTILAQIAAEMLGLPMEQIRIELGDTDFPQAAGSGGSWGAGSSGSALFEACNALREKLARSAGMDPATARFASGSIASGDQSRKLTELVGVGMYADGEIRPGRKNK